jgi:hypothetical protein
VTGVSELTIRYTVRRREEETGFGGVDAGTVDGLVHMLQRRPLSSPRAPSAAEITVADDPLDSSLDERAPRMTEFEIRYTILRDGEEIGFGTATGATVDAAAYAMETGIQRRQWETSAGMPDPASVDEEEASAY